MLRASAKRGRGKGEGGMWNDGMLDILCTVYLWACKGRKADMSGYLPSTICEVTESPYCGFGWPDREICCWRMSN